MAHLALGKSSSFTLSEGGQLGTYRAAPVVVPTLTSQAIPLLLRTLLERGRSVDALVSRFQLPAGVARTCEVTLPLHEAITLSDDCAALAGDRHFALRVATTVEPGALGLMELVVRSAPSIREGLQQLSFVAASQTGVSIELEEGPHFARLLHRFEGQRQCLGRQLNEFAMATLMRRALEITVGTFELQRVQFAHRPHEDQRLLRAVFGPCPIDFDAGHNALVFSGSWLDRAPVEANEALSTELRARIERTPVLRRDVRAALTDQLQDGLPQLWSLARRLGIGERTLQRRLAELETSFHAELDGVRESLARTYLGHHSRSVAEIGALLQYTDERAFARAFKRWTGVTPTRARAQGIPPRS